jgi:hypothetical protein
LLVAQLGKSGGDLPFDHSLPDSKRTISKRAELLTDPARRIPAQRVHRTDRRAHRVVLGAMGQRWFPRVSFLLCSFH